MCGFVNISLWYVILKDNYRGNYSTWMTYEGIRTYWYWSVLRASLHVTANGFRVQAKSTSLQPIISSVCIAMRKRPIIMHYISFLYAKYDTDLGSYNKPITTPSSMIVMILTTLVLHACNLRRNFSWQEVPSREQPHTVTITMKYRIAAFQTASGRRMK